MSAKKKPVTTAKPKPKAVEAAPLPTVTPSTAIALANSMMGVVERAGADQNTDVDKMRAMLDMQMELVRDQRLVEFNTSMSDAQAAMGPVVRKDKGEKKNYAKLERIDNEIRPLYTAAGFTLSFNSKKMENGAILMKCKCLHRSGHVEEYELEGDLDTGGARGNVNKTDIQGLGSTVSYLRRYLTCMIFNVVLTDEDNDGNGVIGKKKTGSFAEAVNEETAANKKSDNKKQNGKVSDAEFEEVQDAWDGLVWDGHESGDPMKITDPSPEKQLKVSGNHLMKALMDKKKNKAQRIDIIGSNTALLRELNKKGHEAMVKAIHELVDQGA